MKNALLSRGSGLCAVVSVLLWGMMTIPIASHSQQIKNYATVAANHSNGSGSTNNVPAFAQASDGNEATYAELTASRSLIFASSSFVEIGFSQNKQPQLYPGTL